jgi:hypothetical protein
VEASTEQRARGVAQHVDARLAIRIGRPLSSVSSAQKAENSSTPGTASRQLVDHPARRPCLLALRPRSLEQQLDRPNVARRARRSRMKSTYEVS